MEAILQELLQKFTCKMCLRNTLLKSLPQLPGSNKLMISEIPIDTEPVFAEKIVDPIRSKNKQYYYHRRFRRVPTIDECEMGDEVCYYEANEQYKRDK